MQGCLIDQRGDGVVGTGHLAERAAANRSNRNEHLAERFGGVSALIVKGRGAQSARSGDLRGEKGVPTMRGLDWS